MGRRALARIRCEADAIGVSLNTEKTRIVTITDAHAVFAFLGLRVSVGTEPEDRTVVPVHDSTTHEDHGGPAGG